MNNGGVSLSGVLGIIFIVLKLVGVISWSWLWVLAPFWIGLALLVGMAIIVGGVAVLVKTLRKWVV